MRRMGKVKLVLEGMRGMGKALETAQSTMIGRGGSVHLSFGCAHVSLFSPMVSRATPMSGICHSASGAAILGLVPDSRRRRRRAPMAAAPLRGGNRLEVLSAVKAAAAAPAIDPNLQDALKRAVAKKAVEQVKPGMVVGLGTGSTSSMAIEELGKLVSQGKLKDIVGVASSYQSRILARQFGVKTVDLNDVNVIDVAFDGADEVDASMNLIKGGGAAHTMEKVVDAMAKKCIILVDQSKVVSKLGLTFPVPVEVLPFAISPVLRSLAALGGVPDIRNALRKDGPVITDLGNMVVDVRFPDGVKDPVELERSINMIPGVVENGLFIGIAHTVLVATRDGNEITIVELAEFVKSSHNAEAES